MSRDLAIIAKIMDIKPIQGYDRVELATIENYPVIVQKGAHAVGDLVVYCSYDCMLPIRPEFEFLRERSYSKLYNMFRIKNMKLCGVYSSGLILPLSTLSPETVVKEGADVTGILGVKKYDPEALQEITPNTSSKKHSVLFNYLCRFKWFRRIFLHKKKVVLYPDTVHKSDETNVEKRFNWLKEHRPDELYYLTEKIEGMSVAYMLTGKRRKYSVFSHNVVQDPKGNNKWARCGRLSDYNIEKTLRKYKENYCIQGEICGPSIQKNIYGFAGLRLFVFKITNVDTGIPLQHKELRAFCIQNGLDRVPTLAENITLPNTIGEVLSGCEGVSVFSIANNKYKPIPREGIVWRSMADQDIGFKAKSRSYQLWFNKKAETE